MKRIVVTGGSGKAGRAVVNELNERGYHTLNVDLRIPPASWGWALGVDLTDLGQTIEALRGADAVIHLAAVPAPEMRPEQETFRNNILSTYNVFSAAVDLGLEKVVWASSETVLGLPFEKELPDYAPIDEQQTPYPESSYALSKLLGEQMAHQFNRRFGLPVAGLRISNIMEPDEYERFPTFWDDPALRKWNLWGYVDARDVAQAARLALELDVSGSEQYIVAAADTVMNWSSKSLMEEVYPTVEIRRELGEFETLLSIDKAREVLGYEPDYSWRDHL
jgi:nucleoside-diphosphate-sugar epimerase